MVKSDKATMSMSELRKLSADEVEGCDTIVVTRYRKPVLVLLRHEDYTDIMNRLTQAETKVIDLRRTRDLKAKYDS